MIPKSAFGEVTIVVRLMRHQNAALDAKAADPGSLRIVDATGGKLQRGFLANWAVSLSDGSFDSSPVAL
jgi:hypothetical protein